MSEYFAKPKSVGANVKVELDLQLFVTTLFKVTFTSNNVVNLFIAYESEIVTRHKCWI